MLSAKKKWIGLILMGMAVFTAIGSGALAFRGIITVDDATTVIRWSVLIGFLPGFVLHIIAVIQQTREKRRQSTLWKE